MQLILGDCLEEMKKLPSESVDLVLTDPPYNMNYSGRGKVNEFQSFANDNLTEQEHNKWFIQIIREAYRILKNNTAFYLFIDFRNYPRIYNLVKGYFDIKNCIVWDKKSIGMGQSFRFQHEFIIYSQKGKPNLDFGGKGIADVWGFSRDASSAYRHPTQKPISVMYKPIEYSTQKSAIVCDPFMGSGTTGVACKELGREFIGIEIDKSYYDIAKKRIANTQESLF